MALQSMLEQQDHGYFQPVGASCAPAGDAKSDAETAASAAQANKECFFKLSISQVLSCLLLPTNHPPVLIFPRSVILVFWFDNCWTYLRENTQVLSRVCQSARRFTARKGQTVRRRGRSRC